MDIIKETVSKNGLLNARYFTDVRRYKIKKYYETGELGVRPVIFVTYKDDQKYPIAFPTYEKCEEAYNMIETTEGIVTLDFNHFFTVEYLKEEDVAKKVHIKLTKHLGICISKLLETEKCSIADLHTREAFRTFTEQQLLAMSHEDPVLLSENQLIPELWSKTLYTPKFITNRGVTPLQFYKQIIRNDTKSINSII